MNYLGIELFLELSDGVTRRKYGIGKVTMIDVERENRSLSMLVLTAKGKVNWHWVYNRILYGLVNESGLWSNEVIYHICEIGIKVESKRHGSYMK